MNNSIFEIEKLEKHENYPFPKISLIDDQITEKENDSLDYNEYFNKDNISFDKFLDIKTKANTNERKPIERKKIDEKDLFKYIDNQNKTSFNKKKALGLERISIEKRFSKKKCGRKRIRPKGNKGEHNKYSDDNVRRRCKHLVLSNLFKFINGKIIEIYNGKIGNGVYKKQLQIINQSQKANATINYNKSFLTKTLREIFSENITTRYTSSPSNHNKIIIDNLLNEKDENRKKCLINLFNLNFLECLKHFTGQFYIKELEGLKCFKDIKNEIINKYIFDGKEYVDVLEYYLKNYEEITNNKKPRKLRK